MTDSNTSSYERVEENANVNRTTIMEHSKLLPWLMITALLSGVAIATSVFALIDASRTEREARMLQYYVLEMDAKLIAAGVKKPDDSVAKSQRSGSRD